MEKGRQGVRTVAEDHGHASALLQRVLGDDLAVDVWPEFMAVGVIDANVGGAQPGVQEGVGGVGALEVAD